MELPLKVIKIDPQNKRIVLSVNAFFEGRPAEEIAEYREAHPRRAVAIPEVNEKEPVDEGIDDYDDATRPGSRRAAPRRKSRLRKNLLSSSRQTKRLSKSHLQRKKPQPRNRRLRSPRNRPTRKSPKIKREPNRLPDYPADQ